jgi:heavy metal sensor kinase
VNLTLRTRLALIYGALVALTTILFGVVTYLTLESELYANLDASLTQAASSLQAVIRKEQQEARQPLVPVRRERREYKAEEEVFAFLQRSSLRDFVGPIPVPDSVFTKREDPVWSAVYEHVLLNSSTFVLQASLPGGGVVWRSDNLLHDSLPRLSSFVERGVPARDGLLHTDYTLSGTRYRMVVLEGDAAEIAAAYPVDEIDMTLRRLFEFLLYTIPVVIILSFLLGRFLASRSLRPVDLIASKARRITAEHLSERLPTGPSNDEIARLSATLNEMIARLERSFEQIRQFTSDASHELKTPLAILMGEIEVALRKRSSVEELRMTLESCLEEVIRLNNVVQGLLELSRAESGQVTLQLEDVDFTAMLKDICEDIGIIAEPRGISVTHQLDHDVRVYGDPVRLHQAILNILENAVKYNRDGGSIKVLLTTSDDHAYLGVTDTGIGIRKEDIPRIFDRFYRIDKARSQAIHGSGLGLSIVRWIVESHNGSIEVDSDEGTGTTFTIRLPLSSTQTSTLS